MVLGLMSSYGGRQGKFGFNNKLCTMYGNVSNNNIVSIKVYNVGMYGEIGSLKLSFTLPSSCSSSSSSFCSWPLPSGCSCSSPRPGTCSPESRCVAWPCTNPGGRGEPDQRMSTTIQHNVFRNSFLIAATFELILSLILRHPPSSSILTTTLAMFLASSRPEWG